MKFLFLFKNFLTLIFLLFFVSHLSCVPTNNFYDTAIIYDYKGTDKFYSFTKKSKFRVFVSPYYQGVSGCKGPNGERSKTFTITEEGTDTVRLGEGDRLGMWNMLGTLFGRKASPLGDTFEFTKGSAYADSEEPFKTYKNLALAAIVLDANKNTSVDTSFTKQEQDDSKANPGGTDGAPNLNLDLTKEDNFNPESKLGRVSIPIDFEKVGLRTSFNFDLGSSAGVKVKTGFCNYKQNPKFIDFSGDVKVDDRQRLVPQYLTGEDKIKKIAKELGLNIGNQSENCMEDTHVEFYLSYPIDLDDKDGDHVASLIPYLSFGAWAPTGRKSDQNAAFSLATGNDGFSGFTLEGALNVNFPGTIQMGFGGGGAFFVSRDLKDFRVPSSKYQYGIYPWKAEVRKRPGATLYLNFSFMAENFSETFSFYLDYIATWHRKDSIKLSKSYKDTAGNDLFLPSKMEDESNWRSQTFFSGLNYKIAPGHEIGVCFQSVVGGAKIYRTTTIMTTMTLNF